MRRRQDFEKNKSILRDFEREVGILKNLDHSHLVKIVASYTDSRYVAMLIEPVASMNLQEYLLTRGTTLQVSEPERTRFRSYFGCLAHALSYLHESRIKHKDIKPSNILIGDQGEIYIADFGSATEILNDNSVSKGTAKRVTVRYQSPEVHNGSKRGRPSDIWSLGVTFLEMTTVLRGETLAAMLGFFQNNGSRADYVYNNIHTVSIWTEFLSRKTGYSRIDNAPMQWIRQMLSQKPDDRPKAQNLFHEIFQASEGAFCGRCCGSDDSSTDASSISELDDDTTIKASLPTRQKETYGLPNQNLPSPSPENKIGQAEKVFANSSHHLSHAPLHRGVTDNIFTKLQNLSSLRLASIWSSSARYVQPAVQNEQEPAATAVGPNGESYKPDVSPEKTSSPQLSSVALSPTIKDLLSDQKDPYACNMPGSFPDGPEHGLLVEASQCADILIISHGAHDVAPEDAGDTFEYADISPSHYDGCAFNPGPRGFLTKLVTSTPLFSQTTKEIIFFPGQYIERRKSDDTLYVTSITMKQRTESLLNSPKRHSDDSAWTYLPQQISENNKHGLRLQQDMQSSKDELKLMKDELDRAFACHTFTMDNRDGSNSSLARSNTSTTYTPVTPVATETVAARSKRSKRVKQKAPIVHISPETLLAQSTTGSVSMSSREMAPVTADDATENFVREAIRVWEAGSFLDPETLAEPPEESENAEPSLGPIVRPKSRPLMNSLRAHFASRRAPPSTSGLTGSNLEALNDQQAPIQRPRATLERASVYMQRVFDDTASSVATSVMSERTRQTFKLAGLMLPSQDRSCDYLGTYTSAGKVDAVRKLLAAGCDPGRVNRPRPAPIFNVVRGASHRHTKCLRALIQHGVDVNVRSRRTGKTPLLEAFEQDHWTGYVRVIHLLLVAGANPNAKDPSGDVPLLKILGGGTQSLEPHRRKALALLLFSSYNTNVEVTPLGTQNKPLHLAIRRNDPWAVGMLLQKSASVIEAENSEGLTPLLLAATFWKNSGATVDQLEILDHLLEKKANVNVRMERTGRTPLHMAASYGLSDIVNELLMNGADAQLRTRNGERAADLAQERIRQHRCQDCQDCRKLRKLLPA